MKNSCRSIKTKDSIQSVEQVIIDANEQLTKVLKNANICKSSIQKVHSLMQESWQETHS